MDGVRRGPGPRAAARRAPRAPPARRRARGADRGSARRRAERPGQQRRRRTAIVDGLLLARGRAYQEAPADEQDGSAAPRRRPPVSWRRCSPIGDLSAGERRGLRGRCSRRACDDLDAVADAAVAQSVFSLAEGNVPEASATLTAAATGEVAFPRLRVADGRAARGHRHAPAAAALEPDAVGDVARGEGERPRAWRRRRSRRGRQGCWATRGASRCGSRFRDPVTGRDVAPAARTFARRRRAGGARRVALAPAGEEAGLGRLGHVLASLGGGRTPGAGSTPAAARRLDRPRATRRSTTSRSPAARCGALLADARDLDGRDLATPGATDAASGLNAGALEARVDAVRDALEAGDAAGRQSSGRPVATCARPLLALSGFALPGSGPPWQRPGGARRAGGGAARRGAGAAHRARRARSRRRSRRGASATSSPARGPLRDRLALLVGEPLPLAPPFTAPDGAGLDATFARPRLGSDVAADALARGVRPGGPGRSAAARGDRPRRGRGGRRPVRVQPRAASRPSREGWAAVTRPVADDRARLCLLATGAAPSFADGPAAGLVLGAWTEAIPSVSRTAALGVHFDSPARPRAAGAAAVHRHRRGRLQLRAGPRRAPADARARPPAHGRAPAARRARPVPARDLPTRQHPGGGPMIWQRLESTTIDASLLEGEALASPTRSGCSAVSGRSGEFTGEDAGSPLVVEAAFGHAPLSRVRPGAPEAGGPVADPPRGAARDGGRARAGAQRACRVAAGSRGRAGAAPGAGLEARVQDAARRARRRLHAVAGRRRRAGPRRPRRARASGAARSRRARRAGGPRRRWRCGGEAARRKGAAGRVRGVAGLVRAAGAPSRPRAARRGTRSAWSTASRSRRASRSGEELQLDAPEYPGGHLDWYSFDVAGAAAPELGAAGALRPHAARVLPTPARFAGQAASRWWQVEDAAVWFGDLGSRARGSRPRRRGRVRHHVRRRLVSRPVPAARRIGGARGAGEGARLLRRGACDPLVRRARRAGPGVAVLRAHGRRLGRRDTARRPPLPVAPAGAGGRGA